MGKYFIADVYAKLVLDTMPKTGRGTIRTITTSTIVSVADQNRKFTDYTSLKWVSRCILSLSGDCGCPVEACFNSEGTITSPFYPSDYPADFTITALITAPDGQRVSITFDDFVMESSSSCSNDFMTLHDGDSLSDTTIGTYCGTTSPGCVRSSSESLLWYFETNSVREERGFSASFDLGGNIRYFCVTFKLEKEFK